MTIHLRSIELKDRENLPAGYPFNLDIIHEMEKIEIKSPVTFFVGENGSGKSTLLEGIAAAIGSIVVGRESIQQDPSLKYARLLGFHLRLVWNKRTKRGFFLRAEDFFGYARKMAALKMEMQAEMQAAGREAGKRSKLAQILTEAPLRREIEGMQASNSDKLDSLSHGESFLNLFQSRFVPNGLYLLDEPEAPLSPLRQLTLISLIKEMVAQDSQFIIATHSPILMGFPDAVILNFDQVPVKPVDFDDLPHVEITRGFLNNPDAYLNHL